MFLVITFLIPVQVLMANEKDSMSISFTDAVDWLEKEAHRIIRESKRVMDDGTTAFPPQVGLGYEAFWLRDYEYTLEGTVSAYSDKELIDPCRLFIRGMRADGASVDCIKFNGSSIYKPGFGTMGKHPVADGSQFTVGVAWHTYKKTRNKKLLNEVLDPLIKTMNAVPRNPKTQLVHIVPGRKQERCPYGFTDTIGKQGDVLFCSLLYIQACRQLSDLLHWGGRESESLIWKELSFSMADRIRTILWDDQVGLMRAATVQCREHDIWGSAFATYLGVTDDNQSLAIANYFKEHYEEIVQHGQIRHLPGGTYWEVGRTHDKYQNGAFWATPTGWFVFTLDLVDQELANQTVIDMVDHFRKHGACEWIFNGQLTLPNYLASASLPLAGIRAMISRRKSIGK